METIPLILLVVSVVCLLVAIGTFVPYMTSIKSKKGDPTPVPTVTNERANDQWVFDASDIKMAYSPGGLSETTGKWTANAGFGTGNPLLDTFVPSDTQSVIAYGKSANDATVLLADTPTAKTESLVSIRAQETVEGVGFTGGNGGLTFLLVDCRAGGGYKYTRTTGQGGSIRVQRPSEEGDDLQVGLSNDVLSFKAEWSSFTKVTCKVPREIVWGLLVVGQNGMSSSDVYTKFTIYWFVPGTTTLKYASGSTLPASPLLREQDQMAVSLDAVSVNGQDGLVGGLFTIPVPIGSVFRATGYTQGPTVRKLVSEILSEYGAFHAPEIEYIPKRRVYYKGFSAEARNYDAPVITDSEPKGNIYVAFDGDMPPGLSVADYNGIISGTPTAVTPETEKTVTCRNLVTKLESKSTMDLEVKGAPKIEYTETSYEIKQYTVVSSDGPIIIGDVTDLQMSTSSPIGAIVMNANGSFSGIATVAGSSTVTVTGTPPTGTTVDPVELSLTVTAAPDPGPSPYDPAVIDYPTKNSVEYESFVTIAPTWTGDPTGTFSVTPALPSGLSISSVNGVISGSPTEVSNKSYVIIYSSDYSTVVNSIQLNVYGTASAGTYDSRVSVGTSVNRTLTFDPESLNDATVVSSFVTPQLPRGLELRGKTIVGSALVDSPKTVYRITVYFDNNLSAEGTVEFSTSSSERSSRQVSMITSTYIFFSLFVILMIAFLVLQFKK